MWCPSAISAVFNPQEQGGNRASASNFAPSFPFYWSQPSASLA